jgi:hypothetical protein
MQQVARGEMEKKKIPKGGGRRRRISQNPQDGRGRETRP